MNWQLTPVQLQVLLSLLEVRRPAPQAGFYSYSTEPDTANYQADIDRQEAVVTSTVQCLIPRLSQITNILVSPPAKAAVATTAGVLQVTNFNTTEATDSLYKKGYKSQTSLQYVSLCRYH